MQLVLTQQLLSPSRSPGKKRENNNENEELTDLVNSVMDDLNSQDRLITQLSFWIELLDKAVCNITGLPEDEDEYTATPLVRSCEEIKTKWPSDYYTIADSNGHTCHIYCHMEELCESNEGWMRVATSTCLIQMRNVLRDLDCTKKMESGLVVDLKLVQVVVYQLHIHKKISVILKCVVKLLDINLDHLMVLLVLILMEFILMVLVSHMVILVVIFGVLWVVFRRLFHIVIGHVAQSFLQLLLHLLVMAI